MPPQDPYPSVATMAHQWTRFEWDPEKASSNVNKHGVSFEEARLVFADLYVIVKKDREIEGEVRWQAIGVVRERLLLLVVHTVRTEGLTETIRIISARETTRAERQEYVREARH